MMRHIKQIILCIVVVVAVAGASNVARADALTPDLLGRAEQLTRQKPTSDHLLGRIELSRASGQKLSPAMLDLIEKEKSPEVSRLLIWRMMPVAAADWPEFRRRCDQLAKEDANDAWLAIFRLYDAAAHDDSAAISTDAGSINGVVPDEFPTVAAERAEMSLLLELGMSDTQAGLLILVHRSYDPLHALLDLDRILARQVEAAAYKPISTARDSLGGQYLEMSHQVVERLFALNLLNRSKEADELRGKAAAIAYLNDPAALHRVLSRLDEKQAWFLIVQPLLASEVDFVNSPPELATTQPAARDISVEARSKSKQAGLTTYAGNVRVTAGRLMITCDSLAVVDGDSGNAGSGAVGSTSMLSGAGNIRVRGAAGFDDIAADDFTFSAESGAFTFGGNVRLGGSGHVQKYRVCTVSRDGGLHDAHSLLEDLRDAHDLPTELSLLPRIEKVYSDDELTDQARYLLALNLLRPHLSWHAPFARVKEALVDYVQYAVRADAPLDSEQWRWKPANSGEAWMMQDIPAEVKNSVRAATTQNSLSEPVNFFWLLKDPDHPDVARAVDLLKGISPTGSLGVKAAHWLADLRCNNTVLTFDILGSYEKGADAPLVMDARAADSVHFKLYRVRDPQKLLAVAQRVGDDFIYRDYGLEFGQQQIEQQLQVMESVGAAAFQTTTRPAIPDFPQADLVRQWDQRVDQLPVLDQFTYRGDEPWLDEQGADAGYFGDDCWQYAERLEKRYCVEQPAWSTWLTNRIVKVPGELLKQDGAYVLVAEANGQKACAPLLVNALDLTMRRCRDGVLVMVDNRPENPQPTTMPAAQIFAPEMVGSAVTDAKGAAFAKVFAAGDRPILASCGGRFAIGGFGRVFDGIYHGPLDSDWMRSAQHLRQVQEEVSLVHAYEDRFVAAAYTDRPTYRPGQTVQFKLIARTMHPVAATSQSAGPSTRPFREEDFDLASNLDLPPAGSSVQYEVINPQGRSIAAGQLQLNDFGTAAGSIALDGEAVVGTYSLRVGFDGVNHVLPDVFSIQYYRRPNIDLKMSGVPATAKPGDKLHIEISGQYYFGKPVAGGSFEMRLVRAGQWREIESESGHLDGAGHAALDLKLPEGLAGGTFRVIASVSDASGRAVTQSADVQVRGVDDASRELADVPRFAPVDQPLRISTDAAEVVAETKSSDQKMRFTVATHDHVAELNFPKGGWYVVTAGQKIAAVFIYGKGAEPLISDTPAQVTDDWVDLSADDVMSDPSDKVWALFDRRQVELGGKLRLLVYQASGSRLLFTYEGRTVVDYAVVGATNLENVSTAGYRIIELLITRRELPNFYLQGHVLPGQGMRDLAQPLNRMIEAEDAEDPACYRVEVVDPHPLPGGEKLRVRMDLPNKPFHPGDAVDVQMRVTGDDGKPRQAEISLAAVDESVYAFGEDRIGQLAGQFSDPHPRRTFLSKSWRSSQRPALRQAQDAMQEAAAQQQLQQMQKSDGQLAETHAPMQVSPAMIEGLKPLSDVAVQRLRSDFRETAAWQPQLRTDQYGLLTAHFVLPDSLTEYRLTAVALTRQTEIGTARDRLRVNLPLATQLFLPRFAVEKDRLLAVAMIFNNTDQPQSCAIKWEASGIRIEPENQAGRVGIPAHGSVRSTAWLSAEEPGDAKVTFQAGADAEQRELHIVPLGREREVMLSGAFSGTKTVTLPAGFVARDLRINIGTNDVAQSLDGIGYLVDYPYGCVEQTMSRFLPAVVVREAMQKLPLNLPEDVAAKLPAVLEKGLARLYNFQHVDGGWGWWEHDATNDGMSIYVVDGLARCRLAGTKVDETVLDRGCKFIQQRLRNGDLNASMSARAWLALVLAGKADAGELSAYASKLDAANTDAESRCIAALACKAAGRDEAALRLWSDLLRWHPTTTAPLFSTLDHDWQPTATIPLGLKLQAQLALGQPLDDCYATAHQLLALRAGNRWESTPATATAIESLTQLLGYARGKSGVHGLSISIAGKEAMRISDATELSKLAHFLHLGEGDLPNQEALPIVLSAQCDQPMLYSISAAGTQRQDALGPMGDNVKLAREYRTLDDKPVSGAVAVGQVLEVHLMLDVTEPREYVMVQDARPAGFEYADDVLSGKDADALAHVEFRDDRMCAFFTGLPAGRHEFTYYLRAETPGVSHVLPGIAYPMYVQTLRGETGAATLNVSDGQ